MASHKTGTREEWLAARLELLDAEKELTRRGDEVARRRQALPWVRVDKDYRSTPRRGRRRSLTGSVDARSCSSTTPIRRTRGVSAPCGEAELHRIPLPAIMTPVPLRHRFARS